jgi:hypothetical protein
MLRIIGFLCIVLGNAAFAYAQQAVSATGGNNAGTVIPGVSEGHPDYSSNIRNSGAEEERIPEPLEILVMNRPEPAGDISLSYEISLNPATAILILTIQRDKFENIKYQLLDRNGKVFEEAFVGDVETSISLKPYRTTDYFLKVFENSQEVMIFKIANTSKT